MYSQHTHVCRMLVIGCFLASSIAQNTSTLDRNQSQQNGSFLPASSVLVNSSIITSDNKSSIAVNVTEATPTTNNCNKQNWLVASIAVLVVGSSGFFAVLSVRWLTSKRYYDYLQQFLIALAVGSLCGDAMLHLIPHALLPGLHAHDDCAPKLPASYQDHDHDHEHDHNHDHDEDFAHNKDHQTAIYKALVGAFGVYLFLLVNRISEFIHIRTHSEDKTVPIPPLRTPTMNCKNAKNKRSRHSSADETDGDAAEKEHHHHYHPPHHPAQFTGASFQHAQRTSIDETVVFKTAANKMVSCNGAIDIDDGRCAIEMMSDEEKQKMNAEAGANCTECQNTSSNGNGNVNENGNVVNVNGNTKVVAACDQSINPAVDESKQMLVCDEKLSFGSDDAVEGRGNEHSANQQQARHYVDMIATGHASAMRQTHHSYHHQQTAEDQPHGHSHSHGHHHHHHHHHDHAATSLRSVVWTVVLGDGLHNFCDGLAIGAQFAVSMYGGISTSLAVFCHELPHELGDFAMLIHCGMKQRTALICNAISAVICFLGMVIGMLIGSVEDVSGWIFMLTAGMFFYIALAAMMPELISVFPNRKSKRSMAMLFGAQNAGILIGSGIMLVIALYEDKFREIFG